ncbi:MAG: hypothetical protein QNJ14_04065 [Woeseiaceae bacterium]|nr:hypothetical protein [Woeseiaceae bacterium]
MPNTNPIGRINPLRVLVGGLVAGLIIVAGEYILNVIILGTELAAWRERCGLGALTAGQLAAGLVITIVYGVLLIWIYAAIRPRFGPGPKTAVIAGLTFWSIAYLLFLASLWASGFVTAHFATVSIAWGLFEAPIAALAGGWLYHEVESPRQ